MDKLFKTLFSMKFTGAGLLFFAFVIGVATFIENDFGSITAKAYIYHATWFNILLFVLCINLIGVIFKYQLYRKEKFPIFMFHVAFLVIAIGAFVTRFLGYEGVIHLREGESSSVMASEWSYFTIKNGDRVLYEQKMLFSPLTKSNFSGDFKIGEREFSFEILEYIPNAIESLAESSKNGKEIISFMALNRENRESFNLYRDENRSVGDTVFGFNQTGDISIHRGESGLVFDSKFPLHKLSMDTQEITELNTTTNIPLKSRELYFNKENGISFTMTDYKANGEVKLIPSSLKAGVGVDAIRIKVKGDEEREFPIFFENGTIGEEHNINIDGEELKISFGSKIIELPFSIKLVDFQLERYAGSKSPSSYASEVLVIDGNINFNYRIYMNHILDYKGFRFYQASYDMDEGGTVLSVNGDFMGTLITYIGYGLLTLGMLLSLIHPNSRFRKLSSKLTQLNAIKLVAIFMLVSMSMKNLYANELETIQKTINSIDKEFAYSFGEILFLQRDGRIKPISALAYQILNKVSREESLFGLTPEQVVVGMLAKSQDWQKVRMIKISHPELNEILGVPKGIKFASFSDFFTITNEYKLKDYLQDAHSKKASMQNVFDKEVIKVDERLNICYMVYTGEIFKIYPKPHDSENSWFAPIDAISSFEKKDSDALKTMTSSLFEGIDKAIVDGDWSSAKEAIENIKKYQYFYGASIIPSQTKIDLEILYNHANIFEVILKPYLLIGFLIVILYFITLFKTSVMIERFFIILKFAITLLFIAETVGLGVRWYISGHAPWSDAYESLIYISWATLLAGLLFAKKSIITLGATSVITGLILFVAHLSWMDPQITNIVPVLKSYWLVIHVSVITASYGFFALGAFLALIALFMFAIRSEKSSNNIDLAIKKLSIINEMSLIVGLVLLTIGNFLGGVWANESWGRYWGWDAKETWALVTILVYAFVIHMRFIPQISSIFAFNVASLISISSVIMTYFGVNFYLSGLHSYAQGDPIPVPNFVYYSIIFVTILIAIASRNRKKVRA